jgi:hypothetical protein
MTAVLLAIVGFVIVVAGKLALTLLGADVRGWLPHLSKGLVSRASRRLPVDEQWRTEEWLAELEAFADRPLTMIVVATRIAVSARAVARESLRPVPQKARSGSRSTFGRGHIPAIPVISTIARWIGAIRLTAHDRWAGDKRRELSAIRFATFAATLLIAVSGVLAAIESGSAAVATGASLAAGALLAALWPRTRR